MRERRRLERKLKKDVKTLDAQSKAFKQLYPHLQAFKDKAMNAHPLMKDCYLELVQYAESTNLILSSGEYSNLGALRGNVHFTLPGLKGGKREHLKVYYSFEYNWIFHEAPLTYSLVYLETTSEELQKTLKMEGSKYSSSPCEGENDDDPAEGEYDEEAESVEDELDYDELFTGEVDRGDNCLASIDSDVAVNPLASVWSDAMTHNHINKPAFTELFKYFRNLVGDHSAIPADYETFGCKATKWVLQFIEVILLQYSVHWNNSSR